MRRRIIGGSLIGLGAIAAVLGIASEHIWPQSDNITISTATNSAYPSAHADAATDTAADSVNNGAANSETPIGRFITTAPGVLTLLDAGAHVTVAAPDGGEVALAIGRSVDINGWLANQVHTEITGLATWEQFALQPVALPDAPGPDDAPSVLGNDMWLVERSGVGSVELAPEDIPEDPSAVLLAASSSAEPPVVTLSWPREVTAPYRWPLIGSGLATVLLGAAMMLSPSRKAADLAVVGPDAAGTAPVEPGVMGVTGADTFWNEEDSLFNPPAEPPVVAEVPVLSDFETDTVLPGGLWEPVGGSGASDLPDLGEVDLGAVGSGANELGDIGLDDVGLDETELVEPELVEPDSDASPAVELAAEPEPAVDLGAAPETEPEPELVPERELEVEPAIADLADLKPMRPGTVPPNILTVAHEDGDHAGDEWATYRRSSLPVWSALPELVTNEVATVPEPVEPVEVEVPAQPEPVVPAAEPSDTERKGRRHLWQRRTRRAAAPRAAAPVPSVPAAPVAPEPVASEPVAPEPIVELAKPVALAPEPVVETQPVQPETLVEPEQVVEPEPAIAPEQIREPAPVAHVESVSPAPEPEPQPAPMVEPTTPPAPTPEAVTPAPPDSHPQTGSVSRAALREARRLAAETGDTSVLDTLTGAIQVLPEPAAVTSQIPTQTEDWRAVWGLEGTSRRQRRAVTGENQVVTASSEGENHE